MPGLKRAGVAMSTPTFYGSDLMTKLPLLWIGAQDTQKAKFNI